MLVILCVSDVRYLNGWSELLIKIMLSSGKHCKLEINDKIVCMCSMPYKMLL